MKIAGQKIKAFAHELTHALDDLSGEMTREKYNFTGKYDKEMIHEATDKMNADRDYGM